MPFASGGQHAGTLNISNSYSTEMHIDNTEDNIITIYFEQVLLFPPNDHRIYFTDDCDTVLDADRSMIYN